MNIEQFIRLLHSYGSELDAWPASLRNQARSLLSHSDNAKLELDQCKKLNSLLDLHTPPEFPGLEARLLNQTLPDRAKPSDQKPSLASFIDGCLNWLMPDSGTLLWRPVAAACMPLVFGVLLGNYFSFGIDLNNDAIDNWDDELYMLSFNDYVDYNLDQGSVESALFNGDNTENLQ
ncbi:MAG: hypothetical protein COC19_04025 [SAR86 cluster bacterium]|uniref:Uncharacterized protein n=1 Tax=SAR86 cluster bacterium TaxID=2030880 RepID=A0A2A4MPQ5_9GAMM|nr:MAG: hypothetical protein COC19_04025 [SAR86 cluster bacterium]